MALGTFQRIVSGRFKPVDLPKAVVCKSCGHQLGALRKGRLILRAANRCIIVRRDGTAEVMCERCKARAKLPLSLTRPEELP